MAPLSASAIARLSEQLAETDNGEIDPTRGTTKYTRLEKKFNKRWNGLKGDLNDLLSDNSYYRPQNDISTSDQIADFREWLEAEIEDQVVQPVRQRDAKDGDHWTASHVRDIYRHGLKRADEELRKAGYDISTDITPDDILRYDEERGSGHHHEHIEDWYLTVAQDLEDIGRRTEQELTREYRSGVMEGAVIAALLSSFRDRIDHSRAGKNATWGTAHGRGVEIVNDASIERYAEVGVEEVGQVVEVDIEVEESDAEPESSFVTAGDLRVCATCRAYAAGSPYLVEDIRNGSAPMPARDTHLSCRCHLRPEPLAV